jgi:hypothetical protein
VVDIKYLCLDEADRMLVLCSFFQFLSIYFFFFFFFYCVAQDMGFEPQIREFIEDHGMPDSMPFTTPQGVRLSVLLGLF